MIIWYEVHSSQCVLTAGDNYESCKFVKQSQQTFLTVLVVVTF
jgi:hypothetical protein